MKNEKDYEQQEKRIRGLEKKLSECESRFDALFEHAGFSILLVNPDTGKPIEFNRMQYERLGYTREEFKQLSLEDIVVEEHSDESVINRKLINEKGSAVTESRHRTKDGRILHMLISSVAVEIEGVTYHQNIESDITELKHAEEFLKKAKQELENRVDKRTAELNEKTIELEGMNTALRVLLQKKDEAMSDIEEKLLINTKKLVLPHLDKIKATKLSPRQSVYLQELESNLKEIVSPFLKNLTNQYSDLTPTEIKVASLIREGRTSKEIADFMTLSENTIETHRTSIRKKLDLNHKKVNLRNYLNTLQTP